MFNAKNLAHGWRNPARFSAMVVGSAGITDELALASVHAVPPEGRPDIRAHTAHRTNLPRAGLLERIRA
jgi:hypothetical protein